MVERTRNSKPYQTLTDDIRKLSSFLASGKPIAEAVDKFQRLMDMHRLRDLLATVIVHGLVHRVDVSDQPIVPESIARTAYDCADAMLVERG